MPEYQPAAGPTVRFRPTMGFVALSYLAALVLVGLGTWAFVAAGEVRVMPLLLLGVGAVLTMVAVADVPYLILADRHGVHRQCLVRRQLLGWDEISAIQRVQTRKEVRGRVFGRDIAGPEPDGGTGKTGLVAIVGRRQVLLSYGRETPRAYADLVEVVGRYAEGLSMPGPPRFARSDRSL